MSAPTGGTSRPARQNGPMTGALPGRSDRREEILRAAAELFSERGFHAVGMRAIAEAVGIRSSSLYHHFPSKMDILHAIALEATQNFVNAHLPQLEGEGPHGERLTRLFRAHIEYFWQHRVEETVGLRELRELDEPRRAEVNRFRRRYQRALMDFIREGAELGEFDVDDVRVSTMAVLNMINGVNDWFRAGGSLTIRRVAEVYADLAVQRLLGARWSEPQDKTLPGAPRRAAAR